MPAAGKAQYPWDPEILRRASGPTVPQEKHLGPFPPVWLLLPISRMQNSQLVPQTRLWQVGSCAQAEGFARLRAYAWSAGYFGFKMCLNYHPRLIPATWIALRSAIDLIISAISFFLFWALYEKKKHTKKTQTIYCSSLSAVTRWTYFPQYLY